MDEDGSAESGRTRLARGTRPHVLTGARELAVAATSTPSPMVLHAPSEATVLPANASAEPHDRTRAAVGVAVPASIDARGSGPVPAGGAPGGADRAPAQSIREAVEQLIETREADEAIAEWMQGGG
jgi:hypothetical protein